MKPNNSIDDSSFIPKDEAHSPSESVLKIRPEIDYWYYHDHEYLDEIEFAESINELE